METLEQAILDFWFGPLDEHGLANEEKVKLWFRKDETFDAKIRKKFDEYLLPGAWGAFDRWIIRPEGRTALVVLLDQFPRNIYRQQPKSFYFDLRAQTISRESIEAGFYLQVPTAYGYFLLMPMMHAEDLNLQDTGVAAFAKLLDQAPAKAKPMVQDGLKYAQAHRDIIARFGRFPHRNSILNRQSTADEIEFLKLPGSSF